MNILASYNWMKEFATFDLSAEEFASELSLKSSSVERIEHLSDRFKNLVIGFVDELKDHPDADRLKIAITDIGDKKVEIVCGGENLKEKMRVIVALPGSKVRWHGEGDLIEIKEAKVRGVKSFGMIVAPSEIGFAKVLCGEHDIWDITELNHAEPGTTFIQAFDIDDTIFDIEVTSNRVDCMSMIGMAREAAAVTNTDFEYIKNELPAGKDEKELTVSVKDQDLCPRYMAVVMDNIKVGPSPLWLQMRLLLSGHRPINNIVDITNYILHEYGQPLHAFDYEKLQGKEIVVRRARAGEDFVALDESKHELSPNNLVIADAMDPIAIGGVMGGLYSGTTEETTTIVFEAATFNRVSVRKTARELNLYSDSQLLFEKGISTQSPQAALAKAIQLAEEIAGGEVSSKIFDIRKDDYAPLHFPLDPKKVVKMIGVHVDTDKMVNILERLGFEVKIEKSNYDVIVPYWRDYDIDNAIDLTEEIARVFGYHNIPSILPQSPPPMVPVDNLLVREDWTKNYLKSVGFTEFYGYSFIGADMFEKYDLDPDQAIKLHNPLSSELTHMRTSLMPSILKDIEMNQGETSSAKIFELSRIYLIRPNDLPIERTELVVAEYGNIDVEKSFLRLKGILEDIGLKTGLKFVFVRENDDAHWHQSRSARIMLDGNKVGVIGQIDDEYTRSFKIDNQVIAMQIDWEIIMTKMKTVKRYEPLSDFPSINRDISIEVDVLVEYQELETMVFDQSSLVVDVNLKDVYRGKGIPDGRKSVTLSIVLRSQERTLESDQADKIMKDIENMLKEKFNAILR